MDDGYYSRGGNIVKSGCPLSEIHVTRINICVLSLIRRTSVLLVYFPYRFNRKEPLLSFSDFTNLLLSGGVSFLIQWNEFLHKMSKQFTNI